MGYAQGGTNRIVRYKETRQKGNIYIDMCKSRKEQKVLWHDRFKMFNDLPNEIKERTNLCEKCFQKNVSAIH